MTGTAELEDVSKCAIMVGEYEGEGERLKLCVANEWTRCASVVCEVV